MGISSGRQPLPVGAEVGTAILEGDLAVAVEISNASGSYDPEITPLRGDPRKKHHCVQRGVCRGHNMTYKSHTR